MMRVRMSSVGESRDDNEPGIVTIVEQREHYQDANTRNGNTKRILVCEEENFCWMNHVLPLLIIQASLVINSKTNISDINKLT